MERILSVHATLCQQERKVLHFVHDACLAALRGETAPSLLPALRDDVTHSRAAQAAA